MIEDVLLLDDAKALGVGVVCSWFTEGGSGELVLGLVHPSTYSAMCCIGDVELELVDGPKKEYKFADPSRRLQLEIAHDLALPNGAVTAPVAAAAAAAEESTAERAARLASHFEDDGADYDTREVVRAPGKRKATAFAMQTGR